MTFQRTLLSESIGESERSYSKQPDFIFNRCMHTPKLYQRRCGLAHSNSQSCACGPGFCCTQRCGDTFSWQKSEDSQALTLIDKRLESGLTTSGETWIKYLKSDFIFKLRSLKF